MSTCPHALGTVEQRHAAIEADRVWRAELPPLPLPTEIARPIVDALHGFYDLFEHRAEALEFDYDAQNGVQAEVDQIIDTVDEVCAIVRSMVAGFMVGDNRGPAIPAMVDPILRAIANTDSLTDTRARRWYYQHTDESHLDQVETRFRI